MDDINDGMGGSYEIRDGGRVLLERTDLLAAIPQPSSPGIIFQIIQPASPTNPGGNP